MTKKLLIALPILCCATAFAQPRYDYSQLQTERLNRGVVAIRQDDGKVAVSWRILRDDQKGEPFDIYRNGEKLNAQPLTSGGSFFVDEHPLEAKATYEVRGGSTAGSFDFNPLSPAGYLPVSIEKPEGGETPDGRRYGYSANDCSVGDVDGDGQYEIFVKWDPSNAHDNAHDGYTGPTLFDCYRLNGERLWRIDMGCNIRSGAHYVPFIVYDLDGDGKAELMVKTADGTRDGEGRVIGDSLVDYRNKAGRILDGPEFISVFNGLTGAVMYTAPYIPKRGNVRQWGDNRGNRSERYLAAVGYLGTTNNGKSVPSAIFCRGYYTRTVIAAWDWDGKKLISRKVFDTNAPGDGSYAGQGNHNLRVADVDGDGLDEITYGSMALDHDLSGLYNTGMGHGDAIHLVADPKDDRLYIWDCHENKRDGSDFRDARTGKVVFQIKSRTDVGRAMAADIDPTNPGVEMWSTDSHGIRTMTGALLNPPEGGTNEASRPFIPPSGEIRRGLPVNFGIWWDGDLLRELLDHSTVWKYNWESKGVDAVQKLDGMFNNGTKSNPCLSADILGDWREEVIVRDRESTELRICVTTIPTQYRINCLMQDIPYRLSVAYQNVGYNQPPETGFYLGPDRTDYLK
jgi:hypothetical protein